MAFLRDCLSPNHDVTVSFAIRPWCPCATKHAMACHQELTLKGRCRLGSRRGALYLLSLACILEYLYTQVWLTLVTTLEGHITN